MPQVFSEHLAFLRQFRERFESTGAVAPSSRFLARALTRPFSRRTAPARILEIGPGTGAVTRQIARQMRSDDRLDLVELNDQFVALLQDRLCNDHDFRRVADWTHLHHCALQDFHAGQPFDYIISGLPLNNFPVALVRDVFAAYTRLLAPGGVLSFFEYMYVRPVRCLISRAAEKQRLRELEAIIAPFLKDHRIRRDWVFVNIPPAWVQHCLSPAQQQDGNAPSRCMPVA